MSVSEIWTIQKIREYCIGYLQAHNDENPRLSTEWLICAATGLSRVELYAYFDRPVTVEERTKIREGLKRRGAGEPLQYVTGEMGFRHIVVRTAKNVLIPRPETEILVQAFLEHLNASKKVKILEVGCGTGCIALSLAKEIQAFVVATDISADAIACARRNAQALNLQEYIDFIQTDCVADVESCDFDALISNPPYIPSSVMTQLPQEVLGFEPHLALDGGADGLDFFRRLLKEASCKLKKGALFACELHETCLDEACNLAQEANFAELQIINDLADKPRVLLGRKQ